MKISLVIPAYNEEKYLGSCLKSVAEHGALFHEVIVIDNASTDRTREIAASFANVRVVSEPEKGLTKARARGLSEAGGDIIAYIDADTHLPPGWTKKLLSTFDKNSAAVCVSGPYIYENVSWAMKTGVWIYWHVFAYATYSLTGYMAVGGNFAAKKSALLEIGGFDTTISFYGEDTDIARRLHAVGKVIFKTDLYMYTSPRRFDGEGFLRTALQYVRNFFSIALHGRPTTDEYKDIR